MGFLSWLAGSDDDYEMLEARHWSRDGIEDALAEELGPGFDTRHLVEEVIAAVDDEFREHEVEVDWDVHSGKVTVSNGGGFAISELDNIFLQPAIISTTRAARREAHDSSIGFFHWLFGSGEQTVAEGHHWTREGIREELAEASGVEDVPTGFIDDVIRMFKLDLGRKFDFEYDEHAGIITAEPEEGIDAEMLERIRNEAVHESLEEMRKDFKL